MVEVSVDDVSNWVYLMSAPKRDGGCCCWSSNLVWSVERDCSEAYVSSHCSSQCCSWRVEKIHFTADKTNKKCQFAWFKCFVKTHKERTHAKNDRQRMGLYEVGNEEGERKVREELAGKGLGKKDSRWRGKWQLGVCRPHWLVKLIFMYVMFHMPIPVATRSKAWVCGRLLAGIAGSNPSGGMDICLPWV
jgi:hypothetical protein